MDVAPQQEWTLGEGEKRVTGPDGRQWLASKSSHRNPCGCTFALWLEMSGDFDKRWQATVACAAHSGNVWECGDCGCRVTGCSDIAAGPPDRCPECDDTNGCECHIGPSGWRKVASR